MSGNPVPSAGPGNLARAAIAPTSEPDILSVLSPGLSAVLDLSPDGNKDARHAGQIIGWREDNYIAWECRMNPKNPWRIVHDGESILRFLAQGRACAIHTAITDWHARGNHRIVYMTWPSVVRLQAVRQDHRVEFETPCKVTFDSGHVKKGALLQLSNNGCRLYIEGASTADKPAAVMFRLPNGYLVNELRCEPRHTYVEGDAVVFGCKTEMDGLTPVAQTAIQYFIATSVAFNRPQPKPHQNVLLLGECGEDRSELAKSLAETGHELIETGSAIEFFAWLQSVGAGLILVDVDMQDPSAIDVARILRQSEGFNDIALVMYGGDPSAASASAEKVGATYAKALDASDEVLSNAIKSATEKSLPED